MSIHELFIYAHADDEVIGAGGQFGALHAPLFVQVTDGAPRDMIDAKRLGYNTRAAYAKARREETKHALAVAGYGPERWRCLDLIDQEAAFELGALTATLRALIAKTRPERILTQPYEGGHPDHDAVALAVHTACASLPAPPPITEMAYYHQRDGQSRYGDFLPGGVEVVTTILSETQCALKRRLFACYRTQAAMLKQFPIGLERFRTAPAYDFAQPPHAGRLHYEQFGWGMTAQRWQELVRATQEHPCAG